MCIYLCDMLFTQPLFDALYLSIAGTADMSDLCKLIPLYIVSFKANGHF